MAKSNEEWRKSEYYAFDPYSEEIAPALLNSVDIKKYIDIDCLIEQSHFESDCLKTGSYELKFLGRLYDWIIDCEGQLRPRRREIDPKDAIILSRNSITYLWMEEKIFLPEYIAARFNLHIRHVHKGLLLGTGPLVDPGFSGKLLIPLHNLTDNDYEIMGGDGIIWVEFTKLSSNPYWKSDGEIAVDRPPQLVEFPNIKDLDDPIEYFTKSGVSSEGGVQSAFHGALEEARSAAKAARESARNASDETVRFKRTTTLAGLASAILIALGVGTIIVQDYSLLDQIAATTTELNREVEAVRSERHENSQSILKRIMGLEKKIDNASSEIEPLKKKINLILDKPDTKSGRER